MTARVRVALLSAALGCGGARPAAQEPAATPAAEDGSADEADPLFPAPAAGWKGADDAERARIAATADDYLRFASEAKTSREAIAALAALAEDAGFVPLGAAGDRFLHRGADGHSLILAVGGEAAAERGLRLVVAGVEAPYVSLTPRPSYEEAGLAMLDTAVLGDAALESWLVTPLSLRVHADRPGTPEGAVRVSVGDGDGEPVLAIPDLLPHLARRVQRAQVVDSPDRLDAVGAASRQALTAALGRLGLDEAVFAGAEVALVPAGPAHRVGVDGSLLAAHGAQHRALAWAAARALIASRPARASVLVVLDRDRSGDPSGREALRTALSRVLAAGGDPPDALTTRQITARSAVLVAGTGAGELGGGVVLAPLADDATPAATRRVLDSLERAGAAHQHEATGRGSPARSTAVLDLDAVAIALPVRAPGAPRELISTFDLRQAERAFAGWWDR